MRATESTSHEHILETPRGSLKGLEQRDLSGTPVLRRFTKVPYALPPTGARRWRRPQPLSANQTFNNSQGAPGDYTAFGPICPQPVYSHDLIHLENPNAGPEIENVQGEDCLYLNIWVPASSPPAGSTGWPVQFHIHGGWLQVGNAMQSTDHDPFDLFKNTTPRIIVSPTYRLNLFGFLAGSDLASLKEEAAPSNYGFWDQRCALEWVAQNISLFGGDANNITVGGLSAGANSTFFQLNYDLSLPKEQRLIKRIYLWSNAVAIQPNATTSAVLTQQCNDLCALFDIPSTASAREKLDSLRKVPSTDLIASLAKMKMHTFRASTDEAFIPSTFLSSLHSGTFTTRLAQNNISVFLGEVSDEKELYKLVNPPSTYQGLLTQLGNYYPAPVVQALLSAYSLPATDDPDASKWEELFAQIVADGQVHASLRGFTHVLLNPPESEGVIALPLSKVHRYRVSWRAKALDNWIMPAMGVCHGLDGVIWWGSGYRADYTAADGKCIEEVVEPFDRFLSGDDVGTAANAGKGERYLRWVDKAGKVHAGHEDELWERGLSIWDRVWEAQRDLVAKEADGSRL
jgi:carboxylesterase type B